MNTTNFKNFDFETLEYSHLPMQLDLSDCIQSIHATMMGPGTSANYSHVDAGSTYYANFTEDISTSFKENTIIIPLIDDQYLQVKLPTAKYPFLFLADSHHGVILAAKTNKSVLTSLAARKSRYTGFSLSKAKESKCNKNVRVNLPFKDDLQTVSYTEISLNITYGQESELFLKLQNILYSFATLNEFSGGTVIPRYIDHLQELAEKASTALSSLHLSEVDNRFNILNALYTTYVNIFTYAYQETQPLIANLYNLEQELESKKADSDQKLYNQYLNILQQIKEGLV